MFEGVSSRFMNYIKPSQSIEKVQEKEEVKIIKLIKFKEDTDNKRATSPKRAASPKNASTNLVEGVSSRYLNYNHKPNAERSKQKEIKEEKTNNNSNNQAKEKFPNILQIKFREESLDKNRERLQKFANNHQKAAEPKEIFTQNEPKIFPNILPLKLRDQCIEKNRERLEKYHPNNNNTNNNSIKVATVQMSFDFFGSTEKPRANSPKNFSMNPLSKSLKIGNEQFEKSSQNFARGINFRYPQIGINNMAGLRGDKKIMLGWK